jgi:hypothetical protein
VTEIQTVQVTYEVEAADPDEAEQVARHGERLLVSSHLEDSNEINTVSIEEAPSSQ